MMPEDDDDRPLLSIWRCPLAAMAGPSPPAAGMDHRQARRLMDSPRRPRSPDACKLLSRLVLAKLISFHADVGFSLAFASSGCMHLWNITRFKSRWSSGGVR